MPKRADISKLLILGVGCVAAAGTGWIAAASVAAAECVTVTTETNYEPSFAHVRIVTSRGGKPLPDVKIDLQTGKHRHLLVTNAQGILFLPKLRPGKQCMGATAFDNARAQLCIDVSSKIKDRRSSFSIELPPSLTMQEMVKAEKMPVQDRVQAFMGIVQDVSGAVAAGTKIQILPEGSKDETNATRIEADPAGHFSAPLPDGVYVAFFQSSGFVTKTEVFEVGKKFEQKGLRISLKLGGC
ncbi:MAG: carboxypeptidase-like regulatory domain-containing protein [Terriglobales bacterium]